MKQNFYKINSTNRFQAVIQFLRKELGWQAGEPLVSTIQQLLPGLSAKCAYQFTYINLAFSPAPDDTVSNLFKVQFSFLSVIPLMLDTDSCSNFRCSLQMGI